ncbi:MAG TPA: DedA family protein [Patescibacteria group bacterium]|nr:DedA family protein [Patescibacteria group bacterium]
MATAILSAIANWIMSVISSLGYWGVVLLMAIESANIPLPSEIIMPFSGFLVAKGVFNLYLTALAGAVGCAIGSVFSYWLGAWGGRPLVEKYGKYILISHHDLDLADRWFSRYGEATVFFSRLLPIVRTFISFPAGIARMNFLRFVVYSFLGSLPWTLLLAWIGQKLGDNWEDIRGYFHGLDWVILGLIVIGIVWWIWRHLKNSK